jgi:hypothetical protein
LLAPAACVRNVLLRSVTIGDDQYNGILVFVAIVNDQSNGIFISVTIIDDESNSLCICQRVADYNYYSVWFSINVFNRLFGSVYRRDLVVVQVVFCFTVGINFDWPIGLFLSVSHIGSR